MNTEKESPIPCLVYCEQSYAGLNGKTAHGLVRFTRRYDVKGVIDSSEAGSDAGALLDGKHRDIPVYADLESALIRYPDIKQLVIGLAPEGGMFEERDYETLLSALSRGISIDSGLHSFLSDRPDMVAAATKGGAQIRDIRKTPGREHLHFFSGKIEEVSSLKIAILGSDSAVGKRTSSWLLLDALANQGVSGELIGTGQTAWMQGAKYSIILDSLINDFVAGEIEHAVWLAWKEKRPEAVIIEGQGSLLHPAYPGGFEIIGAARPDVILFQYVPARVEYDGFPGHTIHPLQQQLEAIRVISGKPVTAICINRERLTDEEVEQVCREIEAETGILTVNPLSGGMSRIVSLLQEEYLE